MASVTLNLSMGFLEMQSKWLERSVDLNELHQCPASNIQPFPWQVPWVCEFGPQGLKHGVWAITSHPSCFLFILEKLEGQIKFDLRSVRETFSMALVLTCAGITCTCSLGQVMMLIHDYLQLKMAAKGHLASNTPKAVLDAAESFAALCLFIDVPQVGDRLAEYQIVAAQLIRAR